MNWIAGEETRFLLFLAEVIAVKDEKFLLNGKHLFWSAWLG